MKKSSFKWNPEQLRLYWFFCNERHKIYLLKKAGEPQSKWTKDPVLLEYKFTNLFRQLDRVTEAWTDRFVKILGRGKDMTDGDLLFHCAMFRLFNLPATYDALHYGLTKDWDLKKAIEILTKRKEEGEQIFTGAYIIPNAGRTDPKIEVICEALDFLYDGRTEEEKKQKEWPNRKLYAWEIRKWRSMEDTVAILQRVPTIGPFIAYEIACDLRHTRLLADAFDINSWANPGPGAQRGIHRLLTGGRKWTGGSRPDYVAAMRALLVMAPKKLAKHIKEYKTWPFEMREIEHSLCEFDKMMRVKNGEGRPRSKYRYNAQQELPW